MEDSKSATLEHKSEVKRIGAAFVANLRNRIIVHDKSKLRDPEKKILDIFISKLKGCTYMSDEYKLILQKMDNSHHYSHNDHHPQFFEDSVKGMSLLSISEMLIDWCAAVRRHADGDIMVSIEKNQERFGYGDELKQILINTVKELKIG